MSNPLWFMNVPKSYEEAQRRGLVPPVAGGSEFATLSQIRRRYGDVDWVWEPWLPIGHVTLVVGVTGVGKSYLTAYLIAVLCGQAQTWPDGKASNREPSKLLFLETEEMRGAYAERWAQMGLFDGRVIFPIREGNLHYIPQLPSDYEMILELAQQQSVSALVLDSLSGGHRLDENSGAMREIMSCLVRFAGELKVPVIAVHHLRKRSQFEADGVTLDRVRGSSTITQFCRSIIGLSRIDEKEPTSPVRVESLKNSFARPPAPFGFEIRDDGLVFGPAPEVPRPETATDRACEFLRIELRKEPQRYSALLEKAESEGISKNTLYRARDALGVVVRGGLWGLPYHP